MYIKDERYNMCIYFYYIYIYIHTYIYIYHTYILYIALVLAR